MNKTKSTLSVVLTLVLLVVCGVVVWKYRIAGPQEQANEVASIAQAVLSSTQTTSTQATSTIASTTAFSNIVSATGTGTVSDNRPKTPVVIVPAPGWTIYSDGQYVVEGAYPEGWYEYDAVNLGGSLQFTSVPRTDSTVGGMIQNGTTEITIYRTPETVAQARAEDSLNGVQQADTTATVAGESVSVIAYEVASSQNSMVAYVPHGGYLYRIVLASHGEPQFSAIYANFLSAFQFTD
jgi:hypothetical protein